MLHFKHVLFWNRMSPSQLMFRALWSNQYFPLVWICGVEGTREPVLNHDDPGLDRAGNLPNLNGQLLQPHGNPALTLRWARCMDGQRPALPLTDERANPAISSVLDPLTVLL